MSEELFESLRAEMMAEVIAEAALTVSHTGRAAFDERVVSVLARMPRHEFVPLELQPSAYLNRPLPIGYEKTVSPPFIGAFMTDLRELEPEVVVLESGAGAGYQAAILAELVRQVYSVDIIEELAQGAEKRLRRLGYTNIEVRVANGYYGLPDHAPYDSIIVTAACELIPPPLLSQLKPGGRMVIPTGIPQKQSLTLVEKSASGTLRTQDVLPVRFSELEEPGAIAGLA